MTANEALVFYLDASLQIDVCRAIGLVRDDVRFPGHPDSPIDTPKTLDLRWLPEIGRREWVVILRDKKIRSRTGERQAFIDNGVRTFCLSGAGNYSKWETLGLIVRFWGTIEDKARERPGPAWWTVTQGGVKLLYPVEDGA